MKYRLVLTVIALLMNMSALAENKLILSHNSLTPPMHTEQLSGFIDLVLAEALKRIGYKLEIRKIAKENALVNANRGVVDGMFLRISGLEKNYPNLIPVPEKIIDWQFVAFSRKNIDISQGWNSLTPYTTAIISGWKIFEFNIPGSTSVTKVKNAELLFSLLNKERSDIILFEQWQGLQIIKDAGYSGMKKLSPPLASREMFSYLHKKHAQLVPKLAHSLREMKNDGTYQKIYKRTLFPLEN